MSFVRQTLIALVLIAGTGALWVAYVPSAAAVLDRVGVLALLGIDPPAQQAQDGGRRGGGGDTEVLVEQVALRALADEISAIGDGQALRLVTVRGETSGLIGEIGVASGAYVEADTVIVTLDDRAERIALDRALILLEDAQTNLDRLSQLVTTGAVSSVSRQDAELALRTAELEVAQAEYDLDRRVIRAPIAGWVGLIDLEIGQRISAQDPLATISDRSEIIIDFRVPERVIGQLAIGQPITVTPLAMRTTTLTGDIRAIDTVVDRASRTLRVQGRLDNRDDLLRSGMAFSVALAFSGETLPAIDPLALQWSRDGSFVWVVRDGAVDRVPVAIRQRNPDSILVEGALTEGDLVVTEGLQSLRPGAAVIIANDPDTGTDQSAANATRQQL
jgi:RND family efflux transporter MFP subunit